VTPVKVVVYVPDTVPYLRSYEAAPVAAPQLTDIEVVLGPVIELIAKEEMAWAIASEDNAESEPLYDFRA
jgi:hypothetical protein